MLSLQSILANPLILHTGKLVQSEHLMKRDANLELNCIFFFCLAVLVSLYVLSRAFEN